MIGHILSFIFHLTLISFSSVSSLTAVILILQQSDLKHPRRSTLVCTKAIKRTVASTTNPLMFHINEQSLIYGIIMVMKRISEGCVDSKNLLNRSRNVLEARGGAPNDVICALNNVKLLLECN